MASTLVAPEAVPSASCFVPPVLDLTYSIISGRVLSLKLHTPLFIRLIGCAACGSRQLHLQGSGLDPGGFAVRDNSKAR
jgi:hypothetical protein